MVALPALILEGDNLRRLGLFDNLGRDRGARHEGHAYRKASTVGNQEHLLELCFRAGLDVEFFDFDHITFRDAVLLAPCLNDCVCHEMSLRENLRESHTGDRPSAKFFPCAAIPQRQTFLPSFARVVKWQTRTFEGRMPKGMGVQVPPRALAQEIARPANQRRDRRWENFATMIFYIYHDAAGEWRWRLRAKNKKTVAISGEGYASQKDCEEAIKLVREAADAPVIEIEK